MNHRLLALAALLPFASGLAQELDEDTLTVDADELMPAAEEACFRSNEIDDFDPLSDEFVLFENRREERFLLTMFPGCIGLGNAQRIQVESDLNRVCSNSAPEIRYRSSGSTRTCPIVKIEAVESEEAAKRLVRTRSAGD